MIVPFQTDNFKRYVVRRHYPTLADTSVLKFSVVPDLIHGNRWLSHKRYRQTFFRDVKLNRWYEATTIYTIDFPSRLTIMYNKILSAEFTPDHTYYVVQDNAGSGFAMRGERRIFYSFEEAYGHTRRKGEIDFAQEIGRSLWRVTVDNFRYDIQGVHLP